MRKSDVMCSWCGAGYRRIELVTRPGKKGEFRRRVCNHLLFATPLIGFCLRKSAQFDHDELELEFKFFSWLEGSCARRTHWRSRKIY